MLARTLGRTLHELGQTMSSSEFADHWQDYVLSPWGEKRDEIHAALISQTIANYAGKVRKDPAELSEFSLRFGPEEPQKEVDPATFLEQFKK